ncbi:MAG: DNA translocase FtsK [Anaerolineales bacterium]|nr:DNA translocase FtsK [Anaerolineales bacterium]
MARPPSQSELDAHSDRIEQVLAAHRLPVQVQGGTVTPRWVRYHFTAAPGARLSAIRGLAEELALALEAPAVRVAREGGTLALEVPRAEPAPVRLLPLLRGLPALPPSTACLGLAEDGRPLLIRLASPEVAHLLVAGTTGSGKTELLRSLALSLALTHRQAHLQLVLIDPKRRGLAPLERWPHCLAPVIAEPAAIRAWLERLVGEMERRDRAGATDPRLVIVVDELADLLAVAGKPAEAALTRLAQRGREAGLHLVAGLQKPAAAVVGPLLKANFPVRLVGRVASAEDARVASGRAGSGAERLLGRGDFLAAAAGGLTRFQAAWVAPDDWRLAAGGGLG